MCICHSTLFLFMLHIWFVYWQQNDVSDWPLYVAAGFGHLDVVKLLFEVNIYSNSLPCLCLQLKQLVAPFCCCFTYF